jgi:hypothetical protein
MTDRHVCGFLCAVTGNANAPTFRELFLVATSSSCRLQLILVEWLCMLEVDYGSVYIGDSVGAPFMSRFILL